jgi:hypothetical protein
MTSRFPATVTLMGVGSIGESLLHGRKATHLSTQVPALRGKWPNEMRASTLGGHPVVNDEDGTNNVRYSLNLGKSWYFRLPRPTHQISVLRSGSVRFFAPKTRNRGPQPD